MKQRFAILAIITLFCALGTASASVVGSLFTGSSGTLTVSDVAITWNPDSAALPVAGTVVNCPGALCWNGDVASATALMFTGCSSGTLGVGSCLFQQEGVKINQGNSLTPATVLGQPFLQFESNPSLVFDLQTVILPFASGVTTNCGSLTIDGQSCVVFAGSPILLTLSGGGKTTTATLSLLGVASDTGVGGTFDSFWHGGFSVTLDGTPAALQNTFCPGGVCSITNSPSVTTSNSGSFFVSTVPEPGSFALIGGGLIGLATLLRRRKRA